MRRTDLSRDQRHGRDVCGGDGACRALTQGVSGAGKSTVGVQLAEVLGAPFLDADEYHSAESIAKLASGTPLTDDDRWPWLARVAAAAREHAEAAAPTHTCVVACSALKVAYRDALRATRGVRFRFVYLRLAPALLAERLAQRLAERLFEPFVSGRASEGTGLGLTISRELAALHGGDLRLVESGPAGAVFELRLPG